MTAANAVDEWMPAFTGMTNEKPATPTPYAIALMREREFAEVI